MIKNNFRTLLLLLVLFMGLLGLVLLQDQQPDPNTARVIPTPAPFLQRIFPDLEVLNIGAIRLQDPLTKKELTIVRRSEDGMWTAPAYPDKVLNAQSATLIARTIALLPYRRSFEIEENTNLAQFGFDATGDFLIQFITLDGEEHAVVIGDPTFESPTFYAIVDDRPEVYLIERAPIDYLLESFLEPPLN